MSTKIVETAIIAARSAGNLLKQNFRKDFMIEAKEDTSLVTNLDKEAQNLIIDYLRADFPDHGFVGEESGQDINPGADYRWVIDPLDGTHNFIKGIDMFGVSLGLLYKNEFAAGIIYMPSNDDMYYAEQGSGAFKNGNPLRVSEVSELKNATLGYDSGVKRSVEEKVDALKFLAPSVFNVRMFGSSVRNLTFLSEGSIDLLLEFDEHLWDFAAGIAIVREAGGIVTDHFGNQLTPSCTRYIASNKNLHTEILNQLSLFRRSSGL